MPSALMYKDSHAFQGSSAFEPNAQIGCNWNKPLAHLKWNTDSVHRMSDLKYSGDLYTRLVWYTDLKYSGDLYTRLVWYTNGQN